MIVDLDLEPAQLEMLQDRARALGLSVDGYVANLVGAELFRKSVTPARSRWFPGRRSPKIVVDSAEEALRRLRAEIYARKEEAVEAVAMANMLARVASHIERMVADRELAAVQALRDGDRDLAHRMFQESSMYTENLERTLPLLEPAARKAEELLAVFRKEESRLKSRARRRDATEMDAIEAAYAQREIRPALMAKRIEAAATEEEWRDRFEAWEVEHRHDRVRM